MPAKMPSPAGGPPLVAPPAGVPPLPYLVVPLLLGVALAAAGPPACSGLVEPSTACDAAAASAAAAAAAAAQKL